jgi:uncharacterized protein (DUF433 family)
VDEIEVRKGPGGKTAFIKGTRTRVLDIARMFLIMQDELIIERICQALPHLEPGQVRAAVEWWRKHSKDIENQMMEEEKILQSLPTR